MSVDTDLQSKILDAEAALKGAFGFENDLSGKNADRFLDLSKLSAVYKEEASRTGVVDQFLAISKSIRSIRSSYLPVEFFNNQEGGGINLQMAPEIALTESYENAFMRMMGMPSVAAYGEGVSIEDKEIKSSDELLTVNYETGDTENTAWTDVRDRILLMRRRNDKSREVVIDNGVFEITKSDVGVDQIDISNIPIEDVAALLSLTVSSNGTQLITRSIEFVDPPTILYKIPGTEDYENPLIENTTISLESIMSAKSEKEVSTAIIDLSKDLWKFSYLLIPPIQDNEISRCINEPDKIISKPFSDRRNRVVNGNTTKPTLLESVIRIRLDRLSGTSLGEAVGDGNFDVDTDSYGMLESLFILRLRSVISGLAKDMIANIDIFVNDSEKSENKPKINKEVVTPQSPSGSSQFESSGGEDLTKLKKQKSELEQQKLIEDSILILLGDNTDVLDLQFQTQRSSSMMNSSMMGGLISVVDLPRKRIDREIKELNKSIFDFSIKTLDPNMEKIKTTLGIDIGIGTLDFAVFALAMFTVSEENLLGLLSSSQYERLKNGEFSGLIPDGGRQEDSVIAINEFTKLIIDGYREFIRDLEDDSID